MSRDIKLFPFRWIMSSVLAVAIGFAIMFTFLGEALRNCGPLVFGMCIGALFGTLTGLGHWLLLRKFFMRSSTWVVITAFSWSLFWAMNMQGFFGRGEGWFPKMEEALAHGLTFGFLAGSLQYVFLRNKVRFPLDWLCVNIVAWPVCAIIGDLIKLWLAPDSAADLICGFLLPPLPLAFVMQQLIKHRCHQKVLINVSYNNKSEERH